MITHEELVPYAGRVNTREELFVEKGNLNAVLH